MTVIDLRPGVADFGSHRDFPASNKRGLRVFAITLVLTLFLSIGAIAFFAFAPVGKLDTAALVEIHEGETFSDIAEKLEKAGVVRFAFSLRVVAKITENDTRIVAGPYRFDGTDGPLAVLRRLTQGKHNIARIRVTIPEGLTRAAIADTFATVLPVFSREEFLCMTENEEGFLFPDTYEFFETATSGDVRQKLRDTFEEKTRAFRELPRPNGLSWEEIVILASIVEKEVPLSDDRRIVAGILLKRLSINMPLQVDAVFKYAIGRGSAELTQEDLRTDSPYNTYTRKGLPPSAICSPSIDALDATLHPADSPYLFYLSGADGTTRFAKDFEGHKRNRERYMR